MKRIIALSLALMMIFAFAACSGNKAPADDGTTAGAQTEAATEAATQAPAAGQVNGRLSGIDAPEGWAMGEPKSDNQLIYNFKHENYDEYPDDVRLSVDVYDYDTPEDLLKRAKEMNEEIGYTVENVTIGGNEFAYIIPSFGSRTLYGTIDGVTVAITHSSSLSIDDADVQAIISGLRIK